MKRLKDYRRLKSFRLEVRPTIMGDITELRWTIETEDESFSDSTNFTNSHFESLIDYVVEKSYRKLKDFYCLKDESL